MGSRNEKSKRGLQYSNIRPLFRGRNFKSQSFQLRRDLIEVIVVQLVPPDISIDVIEGLLSACNEQPVGVADRIFHHLAFLDGPVETKQDRSDANSFGSRQ